MHLAGQSIGVEFGLEHEGRRFALPRNCNDEKPVISALYIALPLYTSCSLIVEWSQKEL